MSLLIHGYANGPRRSGFGLTLWVQFMIWQCLEGFGSGSGHVFNLGHGIHLDVPPENAKVFVDAVHELSKAVHQDQS